MSLKTQGSISGNIHIHIVIFCFWGLFLFLFFHFFLFFSPKYLMPFTETNIEKVYSSELYSLNTVLKRDTTSTQVHLRVRFSKINPDRLHTL